MLSADEEVFGSVADAIIEKAVDFALRHPSTGNLFYVTRELIDHEDFVKTDLFGRAEPLKILYPLLVSRVRPGGVTIHSFAGDRDRDDAKYIVLNLNPKK